MKSSTVVWLAIGAGAVAGIATALLKSAKRTGQGSGAGDHRRRRHAADLTNLPRSAAVSHLYQAAEAVAAPNRPPESLFAASSLGEWIRNYLAYVFRPKHRFVDYSGVEGNGVYDLADAAGSEHVRVAVAGDWGTGTDEAASVAARMKDFDPHFTIHIGDIYYVGDAAEVNENCLGVKNPNNNYEPVKWPIGSRGSFALNGNHEMYANGGGYFDVLLPHLGMVGAEGKVGGQHASFFCLQNSFWRVVAIDTGYNSTGLPILAQIPGVNRIPGVGPDCKLPDPHVRWLEQLFQAPDSRGVIVFSHHQYYSGFEDEFLLPAKQLWDAGLRKSVLWFWGHEHRLAGYNLYGRDRLQAYGRCVGHGGMPLSFGVPCQGKVSPQFYDNRKGAHGYGVNGHVNLEFDGPKLTATYVDLTGQAILEETWSVGGEGVIQLLSQRKLIPDPDFRVL